MTFGLLAPNPRVLGLALSWYPGAQLEGALREVHHVALQGTLRGLAGSLVVT